MHVRQWITRVRKAVRSQSKKPSVKSPGLAQIAAVSLVVLVAVAAIVVVAHQAAPATAAPVAKAVTTSSPAPAKKATVVKGKASNAKPASDKPANGAATAVVVPEVVTITGCLEQKDDTFRLKDTSGAEAPKSRSWKTGFLTKHSAPVTVLDESNRLRLGNHVGERVSVTGTLVDKEIQGRTLKSVTTSCD